MNNKRKHSIPAVTPEHFRNSAPWLAKLSGQLFQQGKKDEALACAIGACSIAGDSETYPWIQLASCYDRQTGMEQHHELAAKQALEVDPGDPLALYQLSRAYQSQYRLENALGLATKAHMVDRENPYFMDQGADLFSMLEQHRESITLRTGALVMFEKHRAEVEPEQYRIYMYKSYTARAMANLEEGNWAGYFLDYAKRLEWDKPGSFLHTCWEENRLWKYSDTVNSRVVVFMENGLGDQIQMARLIKPFRLANPQIEHLTVCCSKELISLFSRLGCVDDATDRACQMAAFYPYNHTIIPCMDLVEWNYHRFNANNPAPLGEFPVRAYLTTNPFPQSFTPTTTPGKTSIAFVWQGNPLHSYDWGRSMPLDTFLSWAETKLSTCTFHSMQYGANGNIDFPDWVEDCSPHIKTLDDSASMLGAFHVVVGVDTSLMHLAGALDRPSVVLHAKRRDWRWDIQPPLYGPRMRHLQQTKHGDWTELLTRLGPCLDSLLTSVEFTELQEAMAAR